MPYFLVSNSDGETSIGIVDAHELAVGLADGDFGSAPRFADRLPRSLNDTREFPEGTMLLIKGEIVVPQPVQVAMAYEVP